VDTTLLSRRLSPRPKLNLDANDQPSNAAPALPFVRSLHEQASENLKSKIFLATSGRTEDPGVCEPPTPGAVQGVLNRSWSYQLFTRRFGERAANILDCAATAQIRALARAAKSSTSVLFTESHLLRHVHRVRVPQMPVNFHRQRAAILVTEPS
jgi:hypothetical protein